MPNYRSKCFFTAPNSQYYNTLFFFKVDDGYGDDLMKSMKLFQHQK